LEEDNTDDTIKNRLKN